MAGLIAADFRRLVADHEKQQMQHRQEQLPRYSWPRQRRVVELIDHHLSEDNWHRLAACAERGEEEFQLLRLASQLCGDGGRAVNVGEPGWPSTLRGEPAEIYWRWVHDLKPTISGLTLASSIAQAGCPAI